MIYHKIQSNQMILHYQRIQQIIVLIIIMYLVNFNLLIKIMIQNKVINNNIKVNNNLNKMYKMYKNLDKQLSPNFQIQMMKYKKIKHMVLIN